MKGITVEGVLEELSDFSKYMPLGCWSPPCVDGHHMFREDNYYLHEEGVDIWVIRCRVCGKLKRNSDKIQRKEMD